MTEPRKSAGSAAPDSPTSSAAIAELRRRLRAGMASDWIPLGRRIDRLGTGASTAERQRLEQAIAASIDKVARRADGRPAIFYPPELPVSAARDEIAAAIREHQVVIVCGETGSGKTTQIPKICLELGRGTRGLIGHTQPRRIAARSVATRIAEELNAELGTAVGYKVRFTDHTRPDAYIKLMTDGILLAETQSDRTLAAYDTIIIDEAHERSLNIDFLLGYLKQLLPQRPDLKLIVTSATLDAERFARHFGADGQPAPVLEVSGRNYPVEVRYRPLGGGAADEADDEEALEEAIVATAEDLWREGPGDILVFLPGEREIRETSDLLTKSLARRPYARTVEILPLFARLSAEQQQRVFEPQRRAPHRARHQRRRDFADGPGHPLRDRLGPRAGQALFAAQQGDAAADRKGLAGGRRSARRTLRPRRRRRMRAPVRRRGLRRAAEIHRARNPALVAGRRHPAHGGARFDGRRCVSVSRAPKPARDRRRLPAAGGAGRSRCTARAHAARPRACRAAGRSAHRPHAACGAGTARWPKCWSSPAPWRCPIRAIGRWTSGRRPIRRTCAFATSAPIF